MKAFRRRCHIPTTSTNCSNHGLAIQRKFRMLQAQCNILIGWTFARWFFDRRLMPGNTVLSIYFDEKHMDSVNSYLTTDGYKEESTGCESSRSFCKSDDVADVAR
jgi:hypothetical protein